VQATDGSFYGTTSLSQPGAYGTVFRLSIGLRAFVRAVPAFGKVGAAVTILGTNLTTPAAVTFGGTPAAIAYSSATEIRTTVPAGANTGKVVVTAPGGTLLSNVPFQVLP